MQEEYLVATPIDECVEVIVEALDEVGLKGVALKKHVPPTYLLVEYSPGWTGKALEIEFVLRKAEGGTKISVKWPYAKELPAKGEVPESFRKAQEEARKKALILIENFKIKIKATDITGC